MRKFLLSLCVALLSCATFAQYNVIVELIDGTEVRYSAKNVKNIRIEKGDPTQTDEEVVDAATSDFRFFVLNDKEVEVTGLNIASATVIVPAKVQIKGKVYTVTSIGEKAFSGREESSMAKIKQIILPNTITTIGESAFGWCESLTSINIPNSVTEIGEYALADCESLTSIEIPNSVTEIGGCAFRGCTSLTSIEIPSSVTEIGKYAFEGNSFKSIVVDKDNKVYDSRENCNAIIETASNTLVEGCQNTVIPNSITSIASGAFYSCTSLTSIVIPNSVTEIGDYAFAYCGLNTARVPKGCKIGEGVFWDTTCEIEWYGGAETTAVPADETGLKFKYDDWTMTASVTGLTDKEAKEVKIPSQVLYNGMVYDVTSIGNEAFYGNTSLTSIVIPNSVTEIGVGAFYGCTNLASIFEIPESVTEIGGSAFYGCTNLKAVRMPVSLKGKVFSADFPTTCEIEWYDGGEWETPTGDQSDEAKFKFEFDATTMTATIKRVKDTSVTSIIIPSTVIFDNEKYTVTTIGEEAFSWCTSLTSINIPNSVTEIERYAFKGCTSLTSIEIPNSVTKIGWGAFYGCESLTSIEIPNSVTSIRDGAFYGCESLTSIEIPNSVTEIGEWAFYGCENLKKARVPMIFKEIDLGFDDNCTVVWY